MLNSLCTALLVVLVAFVARIVFLFDIGKTIKINDSHCRRIGADVVSNSEDITLWQNGKLLISAGDLYHVLAKRRQETPEKTGIYMMDVDVLLNKNEEVIEKVPINGYPSDRPMHFHGFYASNSSDTLYVINHPGKEFGYSAVEIFNMKHEGGENLQLEFVRAINHELFGDARINNIVEGNFEGGEFYTGQYLVHGSPENGAWNRTSEEKWKHNVDVLQTVMGASGKNNLLHCTFDPLDKNSEVVCEIAAGEISSANGVTITADRKTLFVNDGYRRRLIQYSRNAKDGKLTFTQFIDIKFMADNIEINTETGDIYVSTFISPIAVLLSMEKDISVQVPNALVQVSPFANGTYSSDNVSIELATDGSKVTFVTVFTKYGPLTIGGVLGAQSGLLVCDERERIVEKDMDVIFWPTKYL